MQIITGKMKKAKKVVVYGPEGIGKSTFASKFPQALFIDTEGSTADMDVSRTPKANSWTMLKQQINEIKSKRLCETLIIDTIDWAEQMCVEDILAKHQKSGIEDFGYGNGYVYVREEFGRFLNLLQEVVDSGINVVLTAHAQMRKFEQPDELGAYDRYELKLGKKTSSQTSPLVKEWADALLFCNYKTYSVAVDKDGKKHKAQGGKRVMYTSHHPCWDAKNRWELPEEVPFEYASIAHCIPLRNNSINTPNVEEGPVYWHQKELRYVFEAKPDEEIPDYTQCVQITKEEYDQLKKEYEKLENKPEQFHDTSKVGKTETRLPAKLSELMLENKVTYEEIQEAVASRGYYTIDTPIENYDIQFIDGVLVGAWPQVFEMIKENRLNDDTPF
ncbi:ATP-binding protein [Anaerovorax sp. IOR16]|uniref:ATP-binding protein n=1 Tax=Anaerovorax sp. IOR16 TaxID=2773458 RepID=UPI0019CFF843|nr:ATP-binding protein [Anaerovorax sp. IOR16]